MRKYLIAILGVEGLAVLLALVQSLWNVRTDEAKYLLNIPYPHPPFLRSILSATEALPFQELFWRIVLASLFLQAVWLVWDMGRMLPRMERVALCGAWLFSGGVLLWAGTIMIAPVNAVQGLVFVWLLWRPQIVARFPAAVSVFWLISLLTGYQAILYLPLLVGLYWRAYRSFIDICLFVCGPVAVLALFTLSNPLVVASLLHHGTEQVHQTWGYSIFHTLRLWLIGGSGVVSIVGVTGLLLSKRWELLVAFLLVTAFVFLNWFEYYSMLFTPLLIAGVFFVLHKCLLRGRVFLALAAVGAVFTLWLNYGNILPSPARTIMAAIDESGANGLLLLSSTFGHEWQYESALPIERFASERVTDAEVVVCLAPCIGWTPDAEWRRITGLATPVWVRR